MPSFPDLDQPLREGDVALRFEVEQDIPEVLIAHQEDPHLYVRLGLERPPSGAELGRRTEHADADRASGSGVRFTIVEGGSDLCLGQLDVHRLDWDHQRAEVGLWLVPGWRGRGFGRRALRLTAGYLFARCGLLRMEILTEVDNHAMLAAARAAGMFEEGVLRAYLSERGQRLDVKILSLLPSDLEAQP
jgi:RimJ/RimL family protein N-acetyltransferase